MNKLVPNWSKIDELCWGDKEQNWYLMMLLYFTDLKSEVGKRLVKTFPECFEPEKEIRPIPWSILLEEGRRKKKEEGGKDAGFGADELVRAGILKKYGIPFNYFAGTEECSDEFNFPLLPKEMVKKCTFGKKITKNGKAFVVTEICARETDRDEIALSPAQYIDLNH